MASRVQELEVADPLRKWLPIGTFIMGGNLLITKRRFDAANGHGHGDR
jgi:hypothetical protein